MVLVYVIKFEKKNYIFNVHFLNFKISMIFFYRLNGWCIGLSLLSTHLLRYLLIFSSLSGKKIKVYYIFESYIFQLHVKWICINFRFPFYYEFKILFVLWLICPATRGSTYIFKKVINPQLSKHEEVYQIIIFCMWFFYL